MFPFFMPWAAPLMVIVNESGKTRTALSVVPGAERRPVSAYYDVTPTQRGHLFIVT